MTANMAAVLLAFFNFMINNTSYSACIFGTASLTAVSSLPRRG